jgi:hypothetical protein
VKKIKERPDETRVIKAGIKERYSVNREERFKSWRVDEDRQRMATATYESLESFSDDLSLPEKGFGS